MKYFTVGALLSLVLISNTQTIQPTTISPNVVIQDNNLRRIDDRNQWGQQQRRDWTGIEDRSQWGQQRADQRRIFDDRGQLWAQQQRDQRFDDRQQIFDDRQQWIMRDQRFNDRQQWGLKQPIRVDDLTFNKPILIDRISQVGSSVTKPFVDGIRRTISAYDPMKNRI